MKSTFLFQNNPYQPLFPAYGVYVVVYVMGTAWLPLLPQLVLLRGGSPAQASATMAFAYFSQILGSLGVGRFLKYCDVRSTAIRAALLLSAGSLLLGFAATTPVFLFGILCAYSSFGAFLPLVRQQIADLALPEYQSRAFTALSMLAAASALLGALVLGGLAQVTSHTAMLRGCMIGGIIALALAFKMPQTTFTRKDISLGDTPSSGFWWLFTGTFFLTIAGFAGLILSPILMTMQGFSAAPTASTMGIGGIASIPIALLLGRVARRNNAVIFLILTHVVMGAALLCLLVAHNLSWFWLSSALISIAFFSGIGLRPILLLHWCDAFQLGALSGKLDAVANIGSITGFLMAGPFYMKTGIVSTGILFATLSLVSIAALLPLLFARVMEEPPQEAAILN
jgi:predicted MFS family arabinose efflux permease